MSTPQDTPGYRRAHRRVTRERGNAAGYACTGCGRQASEWAYDHTDPSERRDERGRAYSNDPAFYRPLCRHCHRLADREHRRQLAATCASCGATLRACQVKARCSGRECCGSCSGHVDEPLPIDLGGER